MAPIREKYGRLGGTGRGCGSGSPGETHREVRALACCARPGDCATVTFGARLAGGQPQSTPAGGLVEQRSCQNGQPPG